MWINTAEDRNHIHLEKLAHFDSYLVYLLAELSRWGKYKGDRPFSSHQLWLLKHVRHQWYQVRISLSRARLGNSKHISPLQSARYGLALNRSRLHNPLVCQLGEDPVVDHFIEKLVKLGDGLRYKFTLYKDLFVFPNLVHLVCS